ncbi:MAG: DUF4145 domain-containing protein [Desulfobacterales bacterium]|nr:DUF4145 domain-containing protein [Candidatus Omnitrophota bacterium]MCG2776195.1 DUF4145 domain-containing protein [Desulfobacterales bacterium]
MKMKRVSAPLDMSTILLSRLVECIWGISQVGDGEKYDKDHQHLIDALAGTVPIDDSLREAVERLLQESIRPSKTEEVINNIRANLIFREIYRNGMIVEPEFAPVKDLVELIRSDIAGWMFTDEFLAIESLCDLLPRVERFMELREVFTDQSPPRKAREHLIEAIQCYVQGFYQACVIICRSVVEHMLGEELRNLGWNIYQLPGDENEGLIMRIINNAQREDIITETLRKLAHSIRDCGNKALHKHKVFSRSEAFKCLSNTQKILRHIYASS